MGAFRDRQGQIPKRVKYTIDGADVYVRPLTRGESLRFTDGKDVADPGALTIRLSVVDEQGNPEYETDEQVNAEPTSVITQLMAAINEVNGLGKREGDGPNA